MGKVRAGLEKEESVSPRAAIKVCRAILSTIKNSSFPKSAIWFGKPTLIQQNTTKKCSSYYMLALFYKLEIQRQTKRC